MKPRDPEDSNKEPMTITLPEFIIRHSASTLVTLVACLVVGAMFLVLSDLLQRFFSLFTP